MRNIRNQIIFTFPKSVFRLEYVIETEKNDNHSVECQDSVLESSIVYSLLVSTAFNDKYYVAETSFSSHMTISQSYDLFSYLWDSSFAGSSRFLSWNFVKSRRSHFSSLTQNLFENKILSIAE